jgi:2C-methyl-D-erythritol 2,4-cyclodiphosphate synthase
VMCADAILGALCQPDIGQLFPDSDPKWKGQTSDVFVREAVRQQAGSDVMPPDQSKLQMSL